MKTIFFISILTFSSGISIAQEQVKTASSEVADTQKPVFGSSQQAVGDYLMKELSSKEMPSRKAVFSLLIDHTGKVTEAKPYFGSIGPEADTKIVGLFLRMPVWKTNIAEGNLSRVLVVVHIHEQSIATEIY